MHKFMVMAALCALAGSAGAQTVYKCTVGGKVSYGEQPCHDGKVTTLQAAPAGDAQAASEALARDKARLAEIEKQRVVPAPELLRQERERIRAARAADTARQKCERLRLKQRWAEEDAERAGHKAAEAARLKIKRQGEALAVECPA